MVSDYEMLLNELSNIVCLLVAAVAWDQQILISQLNPASRTVFLYFSYGSNMLEKRMRVKCPDATIYGPAMLDNHRLDFSMEVPWWNGAVATISKDLTSQVWGILWIIKYADIDRLDEQEGVSAGWYHAQNVIVLYEGIHEIRAMTYVQNLSPRKLEPFEDYPADRQPSSTYIKVMIMGAVQGGIPDDYIQFLYSLRLNGRVAAPELINNFLKNKITQRKVLL